MNDLVEAFISGITPTEQAKLSNRRLGIRLVITEYENMVRASGGADEAIQSFVQQAKDRAFQEISRHSRNGIPTSTAEFYQDVFEELSTRSRLSIKELKNGTFQVLVSVSSPLPHVVKDGFSSIAVAQEWINSGVADAIIRQVIAAYPK